MTEPRWLFERVYGRAWFQEVFRCRLCGQEFDALSGAASHGRAHVKKGEAVQAEGWHPTPFRFRLPDPPAT